ncbi:MAG: mechanosensitive ion channel domain-containing protein, partial [Pseudomonadota bacterium]
MTYRLVCAILASLLMLGLSSVVSAQTAGSQTSANADDLTPEAVQEMVARMSDEEVRKLLLERLDAEALQEEAEPAVQVDTLTRDIEAIGVAFYTPIVEAVQRLPLLVTGQIEAFANFGAAFGAGGLALLFGLLFLVLAVGYACEKLVVYLLDWRTHLEPPSDDGSLMDTLMFLARRLGRELLGLAVFYVVIRVAAIALMTPEQIAVLAPAVRALILIPRLIAALSRFALAPSRPEQRLLTCSDKWAKFLHRHMIGVGFLAGFTLFIVTFNAQFGVPMGETRLGFWLTLGLHAYIAVIAWTAREGLTDMMRGTDPDRTGYDEKTAEFYPVFAVGVSVVTWIASNIVAGFGNIALLLQAPHYTTMFWLMAAPLIDTAIRGLVRHLQPPMIGEGAIAEKAYKATKRSFVRIGRVLAFGAILLIISGAWNIDLHNLGSASAGERFAGNLVEFLVVCAVGYIIFESVSLWINRQLAKEVSAATTSDQEAGEGGGAGGSRLATVLPMLRATAQIAIATIFVLLAIGTLGIDITPLLAGAGILGLAIGFGAQKLVTDIVSGIFFLIDDAFRVGEYVDVGGTMGTVEKISIRSMQLRHHRGNVHTIPYGSVEKVTNFSRDWVIMKLMFTVPFDTDPNK